MAEQGRCQLAARRQFRRTAQGSNGKAPRLIAVQSSRHGGILEGLKKEENIGRPAAGQCGRHVHTVFVCQPFDHSRTFDECFCRCPPRRMHRRAGHHGTGAKANLGGGIGHHPNDVYRGYQALQFLQTNAGRHGNEQGLGSAE